jgi:RNA polymerase sigma-70 factor, ECF subfamily
MDEKNFLAASFEAHRTHLGRVAFRMLGSQSEAEDAVQEAWLRLSRAGDAGVDNLGGWLTTVVARVCLDMLRSRKARREDSLETEAAAPVAVLAGGPDPEQARMQADSIGLALLVVLQTLSPAERVAFVLHDMFDLPFEEIAPIVGRTPAAARQLASRARRRVRGARPEEADLARRRAVVDAFIAAARGGDLQGLLAVLDPEVVFRADATAVRAGGKPELRGAAAIAATFVGRAQAARPARIDGVPGLAVYRGDTLFLVLRFTFAGARIAAIEAVADPDRLAEFSLDLFEA